MKTKTTRALLLGAAILFTATGNALADTRCTRDAYGNTTCRDSYGNTVRGTTDAYGNSTYRDNNGNTVRGYTDAYGNSTYRDNNGNTTRSHTDSYGNSTYQNNNLYNQPSNLYRQNKICTKDYYGNVTCR